MAAANTPNPPKPKRDLSTLFPTEVNLNRLVVFGLTEHTRKSELIQALKAYSDHLATLAAYPGQYSIQQNNMFELAILISDCRPSEMLSCNLGQLSLLTQALDRANAKRFHDTCVYIDYACGLAENKSNRE